MTAQVWADLADAAPLIVLSGLLVLLVVAIWLAWRERP